MRREQGLVMRWLRWLVGLAVLLLVAWGGYWAVASYALNRAVSECGNEVLEEVSSANGRLVATAFERGCGATSPLTRIVSVRSAEARFDAEDREKWVFVVQGQPHLRLTWRGPEHLTVQCGAGRVMRQALVWSGITISYE